MMSNELAKLTYVVCVWVSGWVRVCACVCECECVGE